MHYFTKSEIILWSGSVLLILTAFFLFDRTSWMTLIASLLGVTSLIFAAKGNPVAQILMIIFSLLYGMISRGFAYYGEMITYLGMTMPMAVITLISWLKHPYDGSQSEVKVHHIKKSEIMLILILTIIITILFYFILKYFHTANLIPSTVSVTTSFSAVCLTFFRSPYFAVAYALNDFILIILWTLASLENSSYISVLVCFIVFLVNDIYGFVSWKRMEKRQSNSA
ncbi:MAG: nicotinamide mononucleotide transporter [Oscillospiraceae bacterium]|nr:nicotinamide mononucleotide transporter [Oscillospiraceae bacterium]